MKDNVELEIGPDGVIRTMYQEGIEKFAEDMGADIRSSCRASDVEWEEMGLEKGWTVRSASNRTLALRRFPLKGMQEFKLSDDETKPLMFFSTRELALFHEQLPENFWPLLKGKNNGG